MRVGTAVDATLLTLLALSLIVPFAFAGAWALPQLELAAIGPGLAIGLAVVLSAYAVEALDRRVGPLALLASLPLVPVFFTLGPETHIGDWDWVLSMAEGAPLLARWYGSAWLYARFHEAAGPFGATALDSVRLLSSIAGALGLYVYFLAVRDLGVTRVLRAWPFLYLSAFGVVGVGLAHVEIYAVVALGLALAVWLGLRVLLRPRVVEMIALGAAAAVLSVLYATGAFAAPVLLAVLLGTAWKAARRSERRLAAAALGSATLFVPLVLWAAYVSGSTGPESLSAFWLGDAIEPRLSTPAFHPADVAWPAAPDLLRPRYWFSSRHLRDLVLHAFLDDRAGMGVVLVLGGAGLWSIARRRGTHPFSAAVIFLAAVALPYAAWAFAVVNMRAQPWDWDVWSYLALLTSLLAASLLAGASRGQPYPASTNALIVAIGVLSMICGMNFLHAVAAKPSTAGVEEGGLRLAVTPTSIPVDAGGRSLEPLWFWLYNTGDAPVQIRAPWLRFGFQAVAGAPGDRSPEPQDPLSQSRRILGSRWVGPRRFACLADSTFTVRPTADDRGRRFTVGAVLHGDPGGGFLQLVSNPIEVVVRR